MKTERIIEVSPPGGGCLATSNIDSQHDGFSLRFCGRERSRGGVALSEGTPGRPRLVRNADTRKRAFLRAHAILPGSQCTIGDGRIVGTGNAKEARRASRPAEGRFMDARLRTTRPSRGGPRPRYGARSIPTPPSLASSPPVASRQADRPPATFGGARPRRESSRSETA